MKYFLNYFKKKSYSAKETKDNLERDCFFGEYKIRLKDFHKLDEYQLKFPLYDQFLPFFCKDFKGLIIDIGANIGDTTLGIFSKNQLSFIVSVEPDKVFYNDCLQHIENNGLSDRTLVVNKFVSTQKGYFVVKKDKSLSTGSILEKEDDSGGIIAMSFGELMNLIPENKKSEFDILKIDTDSFDWDIIQSFVDYANKNEIQPRFIFFEMQTFINNNEFNIESRDETILNYKQALLELQRLGYVKFSLFDNFGTYFRTTESIDEIIELAYYIRRSQVYNKHSTIYYFDILSYSEKENNFVHNCIDKFS